MGHFRKIYKCRRGMQIEEYHNSRQHAPGEKRSTRAKQTPEKVRENNQREKARKAQRLMLEYFDSGDKYITLTYPAGTEKTLQEVRKDMSNLIGHLKKVYEKSGVPLRWIRNIERTKRGTYHIHLLIKDVPGENIGKRAREYWLARHGKVVRVEDTYLEGGFGKLASYLTKTSRDEDGKVTSSYSHSRNMPDVAPEKKELTRKNVREGGDWKDITPPKGYELIKESVYEGINDVTGFPYRRYTLLKRGDAG